MLRLAPRRRTIIFAVVLAGALGCCVARAPADPLLAAAGDIACPPNSIVAPLRCQQSATASLIESQEPKAVAALGDIQYEQANLSEFVGLGAFDETWGAFKSLIHPVPGNGEYKSSPTATGYFSYFGSQAGVGDLGYYSYNLGAWHLIALNSACADTGCSGESNSHVTSAELYWLQADLAAYRNRCLLAYWHQPLFSSFSGVDPGVEPLWSLLYQAGADVVLNGHVHAYERFAQQNAEGVPTPSGIREFVVGTGGDSHHYFPQGLLATSQAHDDQDFGVLFLTLSPPGYSWRFRTVTGAIVDRGSTSCHHPLRQAKKRHRKQRHGNKRRPHSRRR